ncbi:MAG: hypothetical protein QM626_04490 [Microbacterium sp.]|uniref:hypothetical protein n=1 Tax=Microbacterium sp. TaxID=51671 RepID=UPI0039E6D579
MTTPELVPHRPMRPIIAVWILTAVAGLAIVLFVPAGWQATWTTIALGLALIVGFAVQLWYGIAAGFIRRTAMTVLGSMLVLGVISAVGALVTLLTAI